MLKKILAGVSALALSLGMIALVAGPASAHTGDLNVSAVCNTSTGNYDFTATLTISQTNEKGSTVWKVGTTSFTHTPTSGAGLNLGPVTSNGAQSITLGTWTEPGSTTGLGPWVYAFTTWTPDNYTKGSDGQLYQAQALDGSCGAQRVTPTAPTFTDPVCTNGVSGNGSYTIPTKNGVAYWVSTDNGSHYNQVGAGTVSVTVPKTVMIKALATSAQFVLTGTTSWSHSYVSAGTCTTTPASPTVTSQVCTVNQSGVGSFTSGYITIPGTPHVQYSINGSPVSSGTNNEVPGTYTVTAAAVGGYSLTGYPTGGWSLTIHSANPCGNITPTTPTATDQTCSVNGDGVGSFQSGTIVIPVSTQVNYFINGSPASGGSHSETPGMYKVTAVAVPNYTLTGYPTGGWSLTIHSALPCGNVTPVAPSVSDQTCTVHDGEPFYKSGAIVIPASTKVNYFINGSPASGGSHSEAPGTYTVTAVAVPNWTLTGYPSGGWSLTVGSALPCGNVTPIAPTVTDQSCAVNSDGNGVYTDGAIVIPTSTKVNYFIDGSPASAGSHSEAPGTYSVTAVAVPNYTLTGYPSGGWSLTVGTSLPCGNVTPVDPTTTDQTCSVNSDGNAVYTSGTIVIAASTTVSYFIDGSPASAGAHAVAPGVHVVTAVVVPNYTLVGYPDGGWSLTVASALPCGNVTPTTPTATDQTCSVDDSGKGSYTDGAIIIPASTTVSYFINGSPASAGSHSEAPGTYTVTATAVPDYTLTGYPDGGWSLTIASALPCGDLITHPDVTPLVTFTQMSCTANGSYTLSNDLGDADAVIWTVDGSPVAQGTYQVTSARTVTVHAAPNGPDYGFDVDTQQDWSFTFTAATSCDLKTLALTGTTPVGAMLLGYFLLIAGIGVVTIRTVRRRPVRGPQE